MARTPKPLNLGGMTTTATPSVVDTPVQAAPQGYSPPAVVQPTTIAVSKPQNAVVLTFDSANKAGDSAQIAIADATKKITAIAKTSDMDTLGKLLNDTLAAAKGYDPAGENGKGIFGWMRRKREDLRAQFDSVDKRVTDLVGQLDQRIALFDQRVVDLGQIAVQNRNYYQSLDGEIDHLNEGIAYMEANVPVADVNDPMTAQKVQEWHSVIAWARTRADNLGRAKIVATQQDAQISLMQQNSRGLSSKFGELKKTTLPLLQQTFTLYIINVEQAKGAEFADTMDAVADKTLKQNAATLGQNTVAIHTALGRSNFSLDAINANKDAVIKALDDIDRIRAETKARLAAEAPLLEQGTKELAARLARSPSA